MNRLFKNKFIFVLIPVAIFFSFCFWVTELGIQGDLDRPLFREKFYPFLSRASALVTDLKFHFRGSQPIQNKIVVVEIDGQSIERLGRWPWHRDLTSYLVEKVFQANAKVVGLDIVFAEADPRVPDELKSILESQHLGHIADNFETDRLLKNIILLYSDRLVLGWATEMACQPLYEEEKFCAVLDPEALKLYPENFSKFAISDFVTPNGFNAKKTSMMSYVTPISNLPEYTSAAQHMGYLSAILDSDGCIRKTNLVAFGGGKPFPSMALAMASVGLQQKIRLTLNSQERVKKVELFPSGKEIQTSPLGSMQINFRGPISLIPHISAIDLLSEAEELEKTKPRTPGTVLKSDILKDAYVLIGVSAMGAFDMRQFPFESYVPGVYGHAYTLENILSGDPLQSDSRGYGTYWVWILMIFGVIGFAAVIQTLDAIPAFGVMALVIAGLFYLDFVFLFSHRNINWITVFLYFEIGVVFVLTLAAKYLQEENNKKFIRGAFSKYVAPAVVDSILKNPEKLSLGGEKKELSILFTDIRGFTTFSEIMDAKTLSLFLNDYLGIMTQIIFSNQGTLDKYMGDAIMAFWGAPVAQPYHAYYACKAALEMSQALEQNRERFKKEYGIDVQIGIGVNSGTVSVGNMGSEINFEYTVIGDQVNLASRLEGLTKKYGVEVMTSRFTFDSIIQSGKEIPAHRVLDHVKVKGKKIAVELIQLATSRISFSDEGLALFEQGRKSYKAQNWAQAIQAFEAAQKWFLKNSDSLDPPIQLYLERCHLFQSNPPPQDWDGTWEMDSK